MKRILITAAAVGTLAAAAPAFAQPGLGLGVGARGGVGAPGLGLGVGSNVGVGVGANPGLGGWQSIDRRQAQLDQRIDVAVRNGSLTRGEATRIRAEFNDISRLEARYRATGGGLDLRERQDLDRRFDALEARIRIERADRDRDWNGGRDRDLRNVDMRQAQIDRRIDDGVRRGQLDRREASRLRNEFQDIARLEARFRATGGLDVRERQELDRRFDALESRLRIDLADRDFRWDGVRYR